MRVVMTSVGWDVAGRTVVDDVSGILPEGAVTGLIGPNGSGKTTLLHVLAGLRRPTRGRVTVGGDDVHRMPDRLRARRIALLEQHATTPLDLTVRQVVDLGRVPHRGRWPGGTVDDGTQVEQALVLGRAADLAHRRWRTLSGGERQRVQLARALAQEPSVLVLDEPTNHLDLAHQIDFLATVRGLGVTTVAALHDLDLAAAFCDHLVVLTDGRVVDSGPADAVLTTDLVEAVYGVPTTIEHHRRADRLTVVWHR